jgi:hypothetical protein
MGQLGLVLAGIVRILKELFKDLTGPKLTLVKRWNGIPTTVIVRFDS